MTSTRSPCPAARPVAFQLDGEYIGETELGGVPVRARALRVIGLPEPIGA